MYKCAFNKKIGFSIFPSLLLENLESSTTASSYSLPCFSEEASAASEAEQWVLCKHKEVQMKSFLIILLAVARLPHCLVLRAFLMLKVLRLRRRDFPPLNLRKAWIFHIDVQWCFWHPDGEDGFSHILRRTIFDVNLSR